MDAMVHAKDTWDAHGHANYLSYNLSRGRAENKLLQYKNLFQGLKIRNYLSLVTHFFRNNLLINYTKTMLAFICAQSALLLLNVCRYTIRINDVFSIYSVNFFCLTYCIGVPIYLEFSCDHVSVSVFVLLRFTTINLLTLAN